MDSRPRTLNAFAAYRETKMAGVGSLAGFLIRRLGIGNSFRNRRSVQISEAIRSGDGCRDQRHWKEAAGHYARALDLKPELTGIWVQCGHCLKEAGEDAAALAAYSRAAAAGDDPAALDALLHLGHIHWRLGDCAAAFSTFSDLLKRASAAGQHSSLAAEAHAALGAIAAARVRWREAQDHYCQVLEQDPARHEIWVQFGHAYKEAGDRARAEFCYRAAISLAPHASDYWLQLGHCLKLQKRSREAAQAYARAVVINARDSDAVLALRAASGYSPVKALERIGEVRSGAAPASLTMGERLEIARSAVLAGAKVNTRQLGLRGSKRHAELRHRALQPRRAATGPLRDRDIIVFANVDWHYRRQRAQHLASRFAGRGARVVYVSPTFDTAECSPGWCMIEEPHPGLFEVHLKLPARLSTSIHDPVDARSAEALRLSLGVLIDDLALVDAALFVQHPAWAPVIEYLTQGPLIYDCLDDLAAFAGADPALAAYEEKLFACADEILCTARPLLGRIKQLNATLVRNGVEWARFSAAAPRVPFRRARLVIGYFGAISDWFEVGLIARLARRHPGWDFQLIGEVSTDIGSLAALPNVTLTGEVSYTELPGRLALFDVAVIPFKVTALTRAANPVKAYEYLAWRQAGRRHGNSRA